MTRMATMPPIFDRDLPWFPIVMLHRIVEQAPPPHPYNLQLSQLDLARTIEILQHDGFRIVRLVDAVRACDRGEDVSKLACLTFDDGYADFYTHAFPVLQKYAAPATVFLISDLIGGDNAWDVDTDGVEHGVPLLTRAQVLELAASGVDFGSHTARHRRLTGLTPAEREIELVQSKRALEALLDREVPLFAYPHLDNDPAVQREVAGAGYLAAVGGEQGSNGRYLLHRVDLLRLDTVSLRLRLHGWRYRLQRLPGLVRTKKAARRLLRAGHKGAA
jgi:peptidoglycan/xylan/chitin deacetylase (PgdA/CDA1 family)